MEKGEQAFLHAARRADIEQTGVETQVFSQLVEIVDEMRDQEGVNVRFGTDQAAMQMVLDGLGLGKIEHPKDQILFLKQKYDMCEPQYGSMTRDTITPYLEELPITDSLQMMQADSWMTDEYNIRFPHRSQSFIYYRTQPESKLCVVAACSVLYGVELPEWDMEYALDIMQNADGRERMALLGVYLSADKPEDQATLPEKRFSFAILKAAELKHHTEYQGWVNHGPVVERAVHTYDYQNGTLVLAPDPWDV